MKQIAILTSILALTACAGGHHGGGTVGAPDNIVRGAVTPDAQLSNAEITNMVSEILVPSDGVGASIAIINTRGASGHVTHNGKEYDSYKLDDVTFHALMTSGYADVMKFEVDSDTGEVTNIVFDARDENISEQIEQTFLTGLERDLTEGGNSKEFKFADGGEITGAMEMTSYAKNLGLKYSDFGVLTATPGTMTEDGDITGFNIPFAGGYEVKSIDTEDLKSNVTFTGLAKGTVQSAGDEHLLTITDNHAELTFDKQTGTETLVADLKTYKPETDWYKVTVTNVLTDEGEKQFTITFDDKNKTISDDFRFADTKTKEKWVFETGYFGDNGNATEAVALVQYQNLSKTHENDTPGDDTNVNMYLGFGGTIKK